MFNVNIKVNGKTILCHTLLFYVINVIVIVKQICKDRLLVLFKSLDSRLKQKSTPYLAGDQVLPRKETKMNIARALSVESQGHYYLVPSSCPLSPINAQSVDTYQLALRSYRQ